MPRSFIARSVTQSFLSDLAGIYPPFGGCAISTNVRLLNQGREATVSKPMTKLQNWITTCKQLSIEELLIRCNAAAKAGMPEQFLEAACEVAESKGVSADQFVMALAANGGFVGGADAAVHS